MDFRILEVLIASDDHRMLSANAEAWWLVQNDVFVPFESFLTEDSKRVFLARLEARDPGWFLSFFSGEPDVPYLTRFEQDSANIDGASVIRVTLTRLDSLMDGFLSQADQVGTFEAMLSLQEDLFYVYDPEKNEVSLFNTRQSHFSPGVRPLEDFRAGLRECCSQEAQTELDVWTDHLRKQSPRFRLTVAGSLTRGADSSSHSLIFRGVLSDTGRGRIRTVGLIHPVRSRGSEEHEISYDALTGVITREDIIRMARDRIDRLKAKGTAIAILDIDFFKHINDSLGHQEGDNVLRQVSAIVQREMKSAGVIGRIGGDEFLLLFYQVDSETELRAYLRSIKSVIGASPAGVTVSIGAAIYPDDAQTYSDLFMVADYCLFLGKEKGRNRYIIHHPEKHPPVDEIRRLQSGGDRGFIKGRDDLPLGEVLVQIQYLLQYGKKKPPMTTVLQEFASRASIPVLSLWRRDDRSLIASCVQNRNDTEFLAKYFEAHAPDELWIPFYVEDGMCVMNTVDKKEEGFLEVRLPLLDCNIRSYIYIPFEDADGVPVALIFAAMHKKVFWNQQQYPHFRLFSDVLARCRLTAPEE